MGGNATYGFILYYDLMSAVSAKQYMDGHNLKGNSIRVSVFIIPYSGKFSNGSIFVVFNSKIYLWKKISLVSSQLSHKIKSSWVKHLWFYSNHENLKISRYMVE